LDEPAVRPDRTARCSRFDLLAACDGDLGDEQTQEAFVLAGLGSRDTRSSSARPPARAVAEEDFVVCHNRWSGTYGAPIFRGLVTPQGERFSVEHLHVYRMTDGRIAEHWAVHDDLGMMLQLGAIST
jgi:hypothetical protein